SPLNKWNLINTKVQSPSINTPFDNVDGEYCARWMNQSESQPDPIFARGCTALERASANFERLLIATEIIGFDRVFDPPESIAGLKASGSANTAKQATGDPIAGPDGIFTRNQMVFDKAEDDFQVLPCCASNPGTIINAPADATPDPNHTAALTFLQNYNP